MCYYEVKLYSCGDWKWGNFRKRCWQEHRLGETCQMKYTYGILPFQDKCSTCISLDKKYRRYSKTRQDYDRWIGNPERQASASFAAATCEQINKEVDELLDQRDKHYAKAVTCQKSGQAARKDLSTPHASSRGPNPENPPFKASSDTNPACN